MNELDLTPKLLHVGYHEDGRGSLEYVNQLDMKDIRRFYIISHTTTEIQRAWQGHKVEEKFFFVVAGAFSIALVKPDHWVTPNRNLELDIYKLNRIQKKLLHVPGGYATSIVALEENSQLLVFSTLSIEEAVNDDFRFSSDYWKHLK